MSYNATVYNVMISSPSDVITEKGIARDVLNEFNILFSNTNKIVLLPRMWESHSIPLQGDRPQEIINKTVLKDSDLLIAMFWTRIGTPTGKAESGSVEEIEEHIASGKPTLIYFSSAPVDPRSVDNDQFSKLLDFKKSIQDKGLYQEYTDYSNFKEVLFRNIVHTIQNDKYFKLANHELIGDSENYSLDETGTLISALTNEAKFLLKEAAKSSTGNIAVLRVMGGAVFQVNGKGYQSKDKREEAILFEAMEILENNDLIVAAGYKREIFKLTAQGYRIADILPEQAL